MADAGPLDPGEAKSRVRAVLEGMEAEARNAGYTVTRNLIADQSGVARSAVSAWFAGRQLPRKKQLDTLADVLSFGDEVRRQAYRQDLYAAAGINLPTPDALDRAREGGVVTIGIVIYDKAAVDGFFENVVRSFGEFCGFMVRPTSYDFAKLGSAVAAGQVDLAAALWETPGRLLTMRFIRTPIQMGMNMLTFEAARRAIPTVGGLSDVLGISPIMNEGQASYRFAQHVLGIPKHRIVECDYDPNAFAAKLTAAYRRWSDEGGPVPVMITDELMCLKVHNLLLDEILSPSGEIPPDAGLPRLMIVPDEPLIWGREGRLVASHPRYDLALCVKRMPNDEWYAYIQEAWRIFVRGNPDFLARKYSDLYGSLRVLADKAVQLLALAAERLPGSGEAAKAQGEAWEEVVHKWLFDEKHPEIPDGETWRPILDQAEKEIRS
jgi:transcriptional regulator with XRE-family HTH domain